MSDLSIRNELLGLSSDEIKERKRAISDFLYYLGECEEDNINNLDESLLGQSWVNNDQLDYEPSIVIDNCIKPLINKQARFMFGTAPSIQLKPFDIQDREKCEKLNQYLSAILNASKFWSNTLKAFKLATVMKRVMVRLEANPGKPVRIYYYGLNEFSYEIDNNDINKVTKVSIVKKTNNNWIRYVYYYDDENKCRLKTEVFNGDNINIPLKVEDVATGLSKIPCWVIVNEQSIYNKNGCSDIKDLKPLQNELNRRMSDYSDALRFLFFGQTVIENATEYSVNKANIAPNTLLALVGLSGKQVKAYRLESTFKNVDAVEKFLKRIEDSMYKKLDIPRPEELKNIPSAKTLKYIYNDLIGRCSEKWNDWEPVIRQMLRMIIKACSMLKCYEDWDHDWNDLKFNIVINKKYPIPEDLDDKRRVGMEEVRTNVRSHRSYIKEFLGEEDSKGMLKEIAEDITTITVAENEQFLNE